VTAASAVLAVRHCQSAGQAPDAPLTALGQRQADALAAWLHGRAVVRILSSPYARAQQTIAPLAAQRRLAIRIDPRLAERRLSVDPIDDWREVVARSFTDLDARAPGGESGRDALTRGWAALQDALAMPNTVLVSHGQLLSLVLSRIDPTFGYGDWQAMSNPDVFRVERAADGGLRFERLWREG
jgi:2,3-bisphosphoglycerate-dependent phosphoglycerate mutase